MPVGRFRTDPRDLSSAERELYARQLPEGLHVLGSGLGLAGPILLGRLGPFGETLLGSPLAAVLGLFVGGIGGYLLGHWLLQRRLARLRGPDAEQPAARSEGAESAETEPSMEPR